MRSVPQEVAAIRGEICARCETPCVLQRDLDAHGQPSAVCPAAVPRWGRYGRCTALDPSPTPESPGLLTKAARAAHEVGGWIKAGAPLATPETRADRLAICQACSFYNASGNLGLGECQAPGCGCTRAKLALATSRCPLKPPKW